MNASRKIISLASEFEESASGILQPGTILADQYKVLLVLRKTFIVSYACEELNTKETVVAYAIPEKISLSSELKTKLELLLGELASLESQNIFKDYQLLPLSEKEVYIIAKYPNGNNVKQWRDAHNIESVEERLTFKRLLLEAACGIDCLHSHGMLHGEVIPENLLVTKDNELILLNAGISSFLRQQAGNAKSKQYCDANFIYYQAPEIWDNADANAKTEQYALGAITYELISGKKPYDWVKRADLFKKTISTQMPDPPMGTTQKESAAIMRAMDHNPLKRFSSCRRFIKSMIPFRPSPLQIKICAFVIIILILTFLTFFISNSINQRRERLRIAQIQRQAEIEKQRSEAETEKKINEAGQLQWKANELLREVLSRNFDEGQTFGEHITTAQKKYADGEKAIKAGKRAEAFSLFAESLENCKWVRDNAESRIAVGQIMRRILSLRDEKAEKAKDLFPEKWDKALAMCNSACKAYEGGNFKEAEMMFKEVETAFLSIFEDVRAFMVRQYVESAEKALHEENWNLLQDYANKIEDLDSELGHKYLGLASEGLKKAKIASEYALAQKSKDKKDWQEVILHCNNILELDNNNDDAKSLLEEATTESTCNLRAIPKIADEQAICSIEINGALFSGTTNDLIRNLPYNKPNKLRFVCLKDNIQYEWTGEVNCDWKGVRSLDFVLEQSSILLLREADKALLDKKWNELLNISMQLLQLDPQSEKGLRLKNMAELELSCNVDFIPEVDGSIVKAEFTLDSNKYYTGSILRNLKSGQEYVIVFYSILDEVQFEGSCKFKTDWTGVKKITVTMRKTTDVLLEKAQEALNKKDWKQAYDYAEKVLAILPGNIDAMRILEKAELQLTTNLKIKAMLNGQEVEAVLSGMAENKTTATIIHHLKNGRKYNYVLTYVVGGKTYKARFDCICDWVGVKEIEVVLMDEFARLSNYAETLKEDKKWNELLQVAREMLDLEAGSLLAKGYFDLAETNSTKCLQIQPTLNSKPVIGDVYQCEISFNNIDTSYIGRSSSVIRKISTVLAQNYYVTYIDNKDYYWGKICINEDWKGIRTVNVVLNRIEGTIPLGNERLRIEQRTSEGKHYWRSKNEITEEQYKAVTNRNDLFFYSEVQASYTFAGKPVVKKVKNINWDALEYFCKLLTVKCIKEGFIPPTLKFVTINQDMSENSKELRIFLVKAEF